MKLETQLIEQLLTSTVSSYKISLATGLSRQMIGKLRNGQADFRKGSLENALALYAYAQTLQQEGVLQYEAQRIEVSDRTTLLNALRKQTDEILVTGELAVEIITLKKSQLSDTERLGGDLGSGGSSSVLEPLFNRLFDLFEKGDEVDKEISRRIIRLYYIKKISQETVLLRLKQLDY
ncbi:hypothetical protein [Enterococcus sp. LJL51]|uniref:hypothetical protein n=1 Tax=Enterococcus sp. LJL51 TaxID=3416656 RepID=UPI003CE6F23A